MISARSAVHPVGAADVSVWMRKKSGWCILAASPSCLSMPSPSDILLANLPLVRRVIRSVCYGTMDADEIDEFTGFVQLRLIENDYSIIRAFKERSSFGTYLMTVVTRLLSDYRNHLWGKWHPSAEAKRQGMLAIEVERLIMRDRRLLEDALIVLLPKYPGTTKEMLEQIAASLPKRHRRKFVGLDETKDQPAVEESPAEVEQIQTGALISAVVRRFIERLPNEDQLLFYLRFECDMPVPQIARSLQQDQQVLYRLLRTHFAALRRELEKAGVKAADVASLIGSNDSLLDFALKTHDSGPSGDGNGGADEEDA